MTLQQIAIQFGLGAFGVVSAWMAMGSNPAHRRVAPWIGLSGQPLWAAFAWQTQAPGLAVSVAAFTAVYVRGILVQWADPQKTKTRCVNSGPSNQAIKGE